jgi:hypothetical protein
MYQNRLHVLDHTWPNVKLLSILSIMGHVLKQSTGRSNVATKKQNAWMQPTYRNIDRKYDQ